MSLSSAQADSLPVNDAKDTSGFWRDKMATAVEVIDLTEGVDEKVIISRTVEINPHGDLKLIVGDDKVCFVVCSRALSRSAPVWKTMLYGPFMEGKPTDGRDWKVTLPEDCPDAIEIILNIVHWPGKPEKIPKVDLTLIRGDCPDEQVPHDRLSRSMRSSMACGTTARPKN